MRTRYHPLGAARDLFTRREPEVLLAGPAGTGKSRACLEKLHLCALKYPGMRGLIVRKTHSSLTVSGLVTYRQKVLHPLDGVVFFGGSAVEPPAFRYPNGSTLLVGGMDKPSKIMSTEFDISYAQEATELFEADWESITTRLRNGMMPYQQLIADCNPDAPMHWLKRRADRGATLLLESRHEDNPSLTADYLAKLDALTGVRYQRLRLGRWAAAEGLVYEFDRAVHLIDRRELPKEWRRIRVVDFGYSNPFVCQWWAIDGDGRLYLYRELYRTQRLVEDHARDIARLSAGESYEATIADHDAEDRATLNRHGIATSPAHKAVSPGIQAVQKRLAVAGDGKPRLFVLRDALIGRDETLAESRKPYCTEQEFDSYVWPKGQDGKAVKEAPVKMDDHGMDALRYAVAYVDLVGPVTFAPSLW
ncbi:MAG: phage terminase large subunit [Patescibacteria group bacterium]|nr:phage terminase large subunit [Patescibacteria group bacterium]